MSKFDKFNAPVFVGRRWQWVDPLKDIMAKILEVQAGFGTATQVIAEKGDDILETYTELKEEKALAKEFGLELKLDEIKATSKQAAGQAVEDKTPDGGQKSEDDDEYELRLLEFANEIVKRKNGNGRH